MFDSSFDTGTQLKTDDHASGDNDAASATDGTVSDRQPQTAAAKWEAFRETAQRKIKLYMSASRLTLGQGRWVAAASLMGALSLGLLTAGIVAATGSYSVETASLTAEKAPQVVASTGTATLDPIADIAATDMTDTDDRGELAANDDEAETTNASLMPARNADETGTPAISAGDEKTIAELQRINC